MNQPHSSCLRGFGVLGFWGFGVVKGLDHVNWFSDQISKVGASATAWFCYWLNGDDSALKYFADSDDRCGEMCESGDFETFVYKVP